MRATELLASQVLDGGGARFGSVRDVRIRRESDGTFRVIGLVVGEGRFAAVAHAWGYAEGRASGPWLFRTLLGPAARQARFVPADRVTDWGPGRIRMSGRADDLPHLQEARP